MFFILAQLYEYASFIGSVLESFHGQLNATVNSFCSCLISTGSALVSGLNVLRDTAQAAINFACLRVYTADVLLPALLLASLVLLSLWPVLLIIRRLRSWWRMARRRTNESLKQAGESLSSIRLGPQSVADSLDRFVYEHISHLLEWIWDLFEPFPQLYEREHIRDFFTDFLQDIKNRIEPSTNWLRRLSSDDAPLSGTSSANTEQPSALLESLTGIPSSEATLPLQWLSYFDQTYASWKQGQSSRLLITGNSGSGKSSLLDVLQKRLDVPVRRLTPIQRAHIEESAWLEELYRLGLDEIASLQPQAVIVDNLELFFLRQPGGFDELKKLLMCVHNTRNRIFWMLSCGTPFWTYMKHILPLEQLLPAHLSLEAIDPALLAENYNQRLREAGYSMRIVPDKNQLKQIRNMKRRHAITEGNIADYLKIQYFTALLEKGGLNFPFFNQHILQSITSTNSRVLRIEPTRIANADKLTQLTGTALFCLQNLFIHRTLSSGELAQTLLLSELDIQIQLSALVARNLVLFESGLYCIPPLLFKALYTALREKNLF